MTTTPDCPARPDRARLRAERVAGLRTLRRPAGAESPSFDLAYVRAAPGAGPVVLQIPGGPGMAVPLPYRRFRAEAAASGLDVLMVEHRGVGLSSSDTAGADLPAAAMSITAVVEDLRAVLDAEGIRHAIVSGASYGSYVAAAFAATHPDRTDALVLDSALLSARDHRDVREHSRALLRDAVTGPTAGVARKIRTLVERDGHDPLRLGARATPVFEFGGTDLLERWLGQVVVGRSRATDALLDRLLRQEIHHRMPHLMEFDLVAHIAHGELGYQPEPDLEMFDPAVSLALEGAPAFRGESYDLARRLPDLRVPAVVISGDRDLRTPRPVAERAAAALPDGILLDVPGHGHSALDTRPGLLLEVLRAVGEGRHRGLRGRGCALARAHRPAGAARVLPPLVRSSLAADRMLRPVPATPVGLR